MYVICGHNEVVVIINVMCLLFAGKVLIIGGGIANFTNVAATFKVGRGWEGGLVRCMHKRIHGVCFWPD